MYADPAGVAAFAARADTPFGSAGSLLMLGGMWNARAVPAGYGGGWSVLWLAARAHRGGRVRAARAARAGGRGWGRPRWPGLAIAGLGLTGPGQDLLRAAQALWPGFAVLRDGQQFAAPLALAEALGAGLAAAWLARRPAAQPATASAVGPAGADGASTGTPHWWHDIDRPAGGADRAGLALAVCLLLAPVLLLPGLAWGAAGRLRPAQYPAGWLAAARLIDTSPAAGTVLVLPWAGYRSPAWNGGRTMLDPWPRLVSRPVIWNDGPRVGPLQLRPDDPAAPGAGRRDPRRRAADRRAAGGRRPVRDQRRRRGRGGGPSAGSHPRSRFRRELTVYLLTGSSRK